MDSSATLSCLCFCLLSGQTVGRYRQLPLHVRRKFRQLGHHTWRSQNVICDFEVALITAIHTELPVLQEYAVVISISVKHYGEKSAVSVLSPRTAATAEVAVV